MVVCRLTWAGKQVSEKKDAIMRKVCTPSPLHGQIWFRSGLTGEAHM